MVTPRMRSTSVRVRQRRSVTGKKALKVKARKPAHAKCALCGAKLNAVPRKRKGELSKLAKTEKRPERKFGGILCANCTQTLLKERARLQAGVLNKEDVSLTHFKYINLMKK
ncbi:MAG: 50S ribosomal protein L34e [Candidatus Micrarchaeia archaeon]|jgi:large subunit ribosomal protein L34e